MASPCPVPGCGTHKPPDDLMCSDHWALVGKRVQADVQRAWKAVRGAGRGDLARAMREHNAARQDAVAAVQKALAA